MFDSKLFLDLYAGNKIGRHNNMESFVAKRNYEMNAHFDWAMKSKYFSINK